MSRCNHLTQNGSMPPNGIRCEAGAEVVLVAPGMDIAKARRIGGQMCRAHAEACAAEYLEKLGETWTVEPLDAKTTRAELYRPPPLAADPYFDP